MYQRSHFIERFQSFLISILSRVLPHASKGWREKEKELEPPYPISGIHTHHSFGDLGTDISSQDLRPVRVQDVQVWSALASCYEMRNEKRDS
jgi:hypothetical protein